MNTRSQIESFEGRRNVAYPDPISKDGHPYTIGVGHCGPEVHQGLVWTDAQIDAALDADIAKARAGCEAALPWFGDLNEPRQAALIGMAFQMGVAGLLQFKMTLNSMRDSQWYTAEAHMLNSAWAKQTPERARRLARQVATGEWQ